MACWLKQSTAVDIAFGPFLDETDGKTAETGLTITQPDIRLKKNGGAWAQKNAAQTLSHEENGWYEVALDTTDTNTLGILVVAVHESGALPVWREFMVVPAAVYDGMVSGSGNGVRADVQAIASGAITATAIATGAVDADALATDAVNEIADGIMTRASSNWEATAPVKSLGTAVMKAVHKTTDDGVGNIDIYRSDGSTVHASQAITTDAAAVPIKGLGGAA